MPRKGGMYSVARLVPNVMFKRSLNYDVRFPPRRLGFIE